MQKEYMIVDKDLSKVTKNRNWEENLFGGPLA